MTKSKGQKAQAGGQQKKRKGARRPRPAQIGSRHEVVLADCTKHYALAQSDPFALRTMGALPCVPDTIVVPSFKFGIFSRVTFSAGTTGSGFVMVDPYAPFNNASASGCPFAVITTPISVGATTQALKDYTLPVNVDPQSPVAFSAANVLNVDAGKIRCVGLGVRVSDCTAGLYSAGQIAIFRHPSNGAIGSMSLNQILRMPETEYYSTQKGKYYTAIWKPMSPDAASYQYAPSVSAGSPAPFAQFGIACINGSIAPNPVQTFEVEIVGFYEMVGAATAQNTPSHSDPVGFSKVQEVVKTVGYVSNTARAPHAHREGVWDQIKHAIADGASGLIRAGSQAASGALAEAPALLARAALAL